jgi:hypothetical protein
MPTIRTSGYRWSTEQQPHTGEARHVQLRSFVRSRDEKLPASKRLLELARHDGVVLRVMTEPQRNPHFRVEPVRTNGPRRWVLQKRPTLSARFYDVRSVPEECLERWREMVEKANQDHSYKKWRIVSR